MYRRTESIISEGRQGGELLPGSISVSLVLRVAALCLISAVVCFPLAHVISHQDYLSWLHWRISEMSFAEVERISEVVIVDARSHDRYEKEHIPGAVWLAEESWDEAVPVFLMKWQPGVVVVVYCDGGACGTSKRVALRLLMELPEMRVSVLKGGFPAWQIYQHKNLGHS